MTTNDPIEQFENHYQELRAMQRKAEEQLLELYRLARDENLSVHALGNAIAATTDLTGRAAGNLARSIREHVDQQAAADQRMHDQIATALAGYPANTHLMPIIVNAAPFADRPSFWTRTEQAA